MSVEYAMNARIEADYGIKYMMAALAEQGAKGLNFGSRELSLAMTEMQKGRQALGRYMLYSGVDNPYPQSANADNEVIEPRTDTVEDGTVTIDNDLSKVKHIKFLRNGLTNLINKVLDIRMAPITSTNPKHQVMATQALNRALDAFESGLTWLGAELGNMRAEEPGKYPAELQIEEDSTTGPVEGIDKTKEIIEERAEEAKSETVVEEAAPEPTADIDDNRPYTGEDYMKGGRLHPDTPNNHLNKEEEKIDPASTEPETVGEKDAPSVDDDKQPTDTTPSS